MRKFILLFCSLMATACGSSPSQPESTPGDSSRIPVADSSVTHSAAMGADSTLKADATSGATSVGNRVTLNGTLILLPQHRATISLPMSGTVRNTNLIPGALVAKGALLATLENPEFISLQQAFLEAHAQTEYLQTEYLRQQELSLQEAASRKTFQLSKAEYLSMKSRMDAAAAQLALLGLSPETLPKTGIQPLIQVKAPFSGYVTDMKMNLGKHFNAGEPLCEIINKNEPMLRLTAYEKDLDKFRVGDLLEFRINGMGKQTFYANVISIGQQVDNINRSLEVFARIRENNERFRPGMYVTARLKIK